MRELPRRVALTARPPSRAGVAAGVAAGAATGASVLVSERVAADAHQKLLRHARSSRQARHPADRRPCHNR